MVPPKNLLHRYAMKLCFNDNFPGKIWFITVFYLLKYFCRDIPCFVSERGKLEEKNYLRDTKTIFYLKKNPNTPKLFEEVQMLK